MLKNKLLKTGMVLTVAAILSSCGGTPETSSQEIKDSYEFIYNVNYDGGSNRTISVKHGQKATYWNAKRSGYSLNNWFEDSKLEKKFDFNSSITAETIIFAKWDENVVKTPVTVTFNFNYEGSALPSQVTGYKGEKLSSSLVPNPRRLGYEVEGWYLESACSNKFDFSTVTLNGDLTLFANYTEIAKFDKDENGDIIFNNVSINYAINDSWVLNGNDSLLTNVVKGFNQKYSGKIKVNIVDNTTTDNSLIDVKSHQTNIINRSGDYYSMSDVLSLAGLSFNTADYDKGQIADCYQTGKLSSYPLGSYVPNIVFNVELMKKYSPAYANESKTPSTYAEFQTLLTAAKDDGKTTMIVGNDWPWLENGCNLPWSQNDIMKYSFDETTGKHTTEWSTEAGQARALAAAKTIYDTWNPNSILGAKASFGDSWSPETWTGVKTGTALFGLSSIMNNSLSALEDGKTAIIPANQLFNATNQKNSKTFVGNYSVGITSHELGEDYYKVAASGVFADFLAKNFKAIGDAGLYPASKTIEAGAFATSTSTLAKVLRASGTQEDFITLPGHSSEYQLFNDDKCKTVSSIIELQSWDEALVLETIKAEGESIGSLIA